MTQAADLDQVVRQRIRSLRIARGWTLDTLAARCHLSPSNLSRIETGSRRIALDQLVPIAKALGATLDDLIASDDDEDVVIRPQKSAAAGKTIWLLSREQPASGVTVAKMRLTSRAKAHGELAVHPGRDWFTVLSGAAELRLGHRTIVVREGESAEFSTMTPHSIGAHGGPVEILTVFDRDGERTHLPQSAAHHR